MRGLFHTVLTLLAFCLFEVYATPQPDQTLNARRPLPSRAFVARSPLPSRAYVARAPQPSRALQARSPLPSRALGARSPLPSRAYEARSPIPSRALEARAPKPSRAFDRRSTLEEEQIAMSEEEMISNALCPYALTACPNNPNSRPTSIESWLREGFECVDVQSDLNSCGGCATVSESRDCTTIPNAVGVSCIAGSCRIDSCQSGFVQSINGTSCVRAD
ncbi:hypothetical protein QCA50_002297 [Cerrena zonata]|uniref:Protein CPL1-like domain-containing protein n=1 Tax=Cerrena zonata TaxID=2478898 RepID=A0AAW0GR51_9APHY